MIKNFDEEAYLEANPDVREAVESGDFPSVALYLKHFGLQRIEHGKTKFHKDFEPFSEQSYLEEFPEVEALLHSGAFKSAFDHFVQVGYGTMLTYLENKNNIINPPQESIADEERLIKGFNEAAYLEANLDVKEALERGDFPSVEIYLEQFGLKRIEAGVSQFHKDFEPFNQVVYLESTPEVKEAVKNGTFASVFEHFCKVGYINLLEVKNHKKNIINPLVKDVLTDDRLIKGFDEETYLEANPDINEALKKGAFPNVEIYLQQFGIERMKDEQSKFHKDFEPFDSVEYLKLITDLPAMIEKNIFIDEFDHFCKVGYEQIINRKINWNLTGTPYVIPDIQKNIKPVGSIGEYENGRIRGWCYAEEKFDLLLLIDGRPCKIIKSDITMPRVAQNNNFKRDDIGFVANVTENFIGATNISLYAIFPNSCIMITSTNKFVINHIAPRSLSVFNDLKDISSQEKSVAIIVWDVTHNPIGRAKVLYDIVKEKHPVIMIGFDFGFSKSDVWEPIISSDIKLLSIKWDERELYNNIMKDMNIAFDTVWICKPRLPSFVLADIFSNEETNFILDIDDNEGEMSQSKASLPKPYGFLGNHLAESIIERIDAKSIASISIQDRWGGKFIRHARVSTNSENISPRRKLPEKIKVGFFGTIRPHKNIHKAAESIKNITKELGFDLEFHVGGHFYPDEIRETIKGFDAKTYGMIPNTKLQELLNDMDVLMTGFPLDSNENEITKYQISSKIGDALSAGRPVLVPEGSSVRDLDKIPGIYLFNEENFTDQLLNAINHKDNIILPTLFTLSDNYKRFKKLQKKASKKKKSEIFNVPLVSYLPKENLESYRPTLVLLWKQPDSTLYGRRVDQLARSYKRKYPDHRVILIETINTAQEKQYMSQKDYYIADSSLIIEGKAYYLETRRN